MIFCQAIKPKGQERRHGLLPLFCLYESLRQTRFFPRKNTASVPGPECAPTIGPM